MKVYFWKRDGEVFHFAATTEAEGKRIAKKLGGFTTAPVGSCTVQEFEAAGSKAHIDGSGKVVLGISPEEQEQQDKANRRSEIGTALDGIDVKSVRSARAVATALANNQTPEAGDVQRLNQWETEAATLRSELAAL